MSNMSYCRFRNTLSDLQDCRENLRVKLHPGSLEERSAREDLIRLCREIADDFDDCDETDPTQFYESDDDSEEGESDEA